MKDIFIQSKVVDIFPKFKMAAWIFSSCEFGHCGVLIVWYLCSVQNLAQITGSALSLRCCKAHAKINGKIEKNRPPCKIVTHEGFNLKLATRDYVANATHHATLGSNQPAGGLPFK